MPRLTLRRGKLRCLLPAGDSTKRTGRSSARLQHRRVEIHLELARRKGARGVLRAERVVFLREQRQLRAQALDEAALSGNLVAFHHRTPRVGRLHQVEAALHVREVGVLRINDAPQVDDLIFEHHLFIPQIDIVRGIRGRVKVKL